MALAEATRTTIGGDRARVLQLLKAIASGNWGLIARVIRGAAVEAQDAGWSASGLFALRLWIEDVLADQEAFYNRDERFGLDRRVPYVQLKEAQRRAALPVRPSLAVARCTLALMGH